MRKVLIILTIIVIAIFCSFTQDRYCIQNPGLKKDTITIKTFKVDNGWGYDIYIKNNKYIRQKNIPAINGSKPFKTKADALKTAELVKTKIRKNILPPTVSVTELDSIGII